MARRLSMIDLHQLLLRIRKGESNNYIHETYGTHKTVIRKLRKIAKENNWLDEEFIPDEQAVSNEYYKKGNNKEAASTILLNRYQDDIDRWLEEKYSFVVIHTLLTDKIGSATPSETTVRNYIHKTFPQKIKPVLNRDHEYGTAEIDFGHFGILYDPLERRRRKAYFLSCRFAFSRHAYRKVILNLDTVSTIHALEECFMFFNAVPIKLVLDNFKAAVLKAGLHDPTITPLFYQFAKYYGILLSPCKAYTPEHKGGVESDVKYVKKNFLPIFRERQKAIGHDVAYLTDLQPALDQWTADVNKRKMKLKEQTVNMLFDEEMPHLKTLPADRFDIVAIAEPTVRKDFHVQFDSNFYSVPDKYIGRKAELFAHFRQIRVKIDGEIVAVHEKLTGRGKRSTKKEHCTYIGYDYMMHSKSVVLMKARDIGPSVFSIIERLLTDKVIDRLNSARGIVFLTRQYPKNRIEAACTRALTYGNISYIAVKKILEKNLDELPIDKSVDQTGQYLFSFARSGNYYT